MRKTPRQTRGFAMFVDPGRIGLPPRQCAPVRNSFVDLTRIGLVSPQCECGVLPLYYRPFYF